MGNTVLKRVGKVALGAVGALEAACEDLGSNAAMGLAAIEEVELDVQMDENVATDPAYNDAVTDVDFSGVKCNAVLRGVTYITAKNLAKAMHATETNTGNLVFSGGGGTPNYFTGYLHGFRLDGDAKILHICKAYVKPGTSLKLGKEQQKVDIPLVLMVDLDNEYTLDDKTYRMWAFKDDSADSTAPTVSTITPAADATAIAVGTTITWEFSEAIRSEDMTTKNFFAFKDTDGAAVTGALTISGDNKTVTLTPASNLSAATRYGRVANQGVRDTAGNPLAAKHTKFFTTA